MEFERRLQLSGVERVAGLDEAGRGSLAGPVSAGAAILPIQPSARVRSLARDSKTLSPAQRNAAYEAIAEDAVSHAVGWASAAEIDRIGIAAATRLAMRRALIRLRPAADGLLIDAISLPSSDLPQKSIIRGDGKSLSIAAASIVAKVERDRLMTKLAGEYPQYGFESHKGYGTARHLAAIRAHGGCSLHRMSFAPLKSAPTRAPRPSAAETGAWAEAFAARALEDRGMSVIRRNYRTRFGEVDLIALDGDALAFVEVRARAESAIAAPAETISPAKARRLVAACEEFLQSANIAWADWRIDVAAVELDRWGRPAAVEFIESAIEE